MPRCPIEGCTAPDMSPDEWKEHMSLTHGGYTETQKLDAGIREQNDAARDVLPFEIPEPAKRATGRTTKKDKMDGERIGKMIVRKLARVPYRAWAAVLHDPRFDLTPDERAELTEAYLELLAGMNVDFSGAKWAILAVLCINADLVMDRLGYMGIVFPGDDDEAETRPDA